MLMGQGEGGEVEQAVKERKVGVAQWVGDVRGGDSSVSSFSSVFTKQFNQPRWYTSATPTQQLTPLGASSIYTALTTFT